MHNNDRDAVTLRVSQAATDARSLGLLVHTTRRCSTDGGPQSSMAWPGGPKPVSKRPDIPSLVFRDTSSKTNLFYSVLLPRTVPSRQEVRAESPPPLNETSIAKRPSVGFKRSSTHTMVATGVMMMTKRRKSHQRHRRLPTPRTRRAAPPS